MLARALGADRQPARLGDQRARRVPESCYCAQFLDHLPGQRGARGPVRLRRGGLAVMDEAPGITRAWGPSGIA